MWLDGFCLNLPQGLPCQPPWHTGHPGLPLSQNQEGLMVKDQRCRARGSPTSSPPHPQNPQEPTSPFHAQALLPQLLQAKRHKGNSGMGISRKTVALLGRLNTWE